VIINYSVFPAQLFPQELLRPDKVFANENSFLLRLIYHYRVRNHEHVLLETALV
jgi:hypothetical protein